MAIGGTARALARLVAFARWGERPPSINQLSIGAEELAGLADKLALTGRKARSRIPGMDPRRVDLIPVGAVIVSTVLEHLGFADVTVSEWGLREGLVLRTLGLDGSAEGVRRAAVDRLAGPVANPHAERVGRLAVQLFDATAPLHGLSGADRELLEHAARLHDLGARNGHADAQHKAGASILERAGLRGFSPEEVATLSGLVRNQRGQPKPGRPPLGRLGPDRLDAALRLLAMLRFAHAVDRAPGGEVHSLAVRASRPGVAVELETDGGSDLDLRDVTRELTSLEAAIGVTVEVHVPLVVAASA